MQCQPLRHTHTHLRAVWGGVVLVGAISEVFGVGGSGLSEHEVRVQLLGGREELLHLLSVTLTLRAQARELRLQVACPAAHGRHGVLVRLDLRQDGVQLLAEAPLRTRANESGEESRDDHLATTGSLWFQPRLQIVCASKIDCLSKRFRDSGARVEWSTFKLSYRHRWNVVTIWRTDWISAAFLKSSYLLSRPSE
eukprot:1452780-Pyramimonas_sp.AAC.1